MVKERKYIKQKLDDYRWICCLIDHTSHDLETCMKKTKDVMNKVSNYTGDFKIFASEQISRHMNECERLNAKIKKLSKEKLMVEAAIDTIEDFDVKQVMKLKYLEYLKWPEICSITKHHDKQCHKLHEKGLNLLRIIFS